MMFLLCVKKEGFASLRGEALSGYLFGGHDLVVAIIATAAVIHRPGVIAFGPSGRRIRKDWIAADGTLQKSLRAVAR
jgi:hypothetical protein